jgi:hypothetical protein
MSHRILKAGVPPSKGLFSDAADTFESYYYWMKDGITASWTGQKPKAGGWSISEYRTSQVVVYHANEDDDDGGAVVGGSNV